MPGLEEQCESDRSQPESDPARRIDALLENRPSEQQHPERHGKGQHCRFARLAHRQREVVE